MQAVLKTFGTFHSSNIYKMECHTLELGMGFFSIKSVVYLIVAKRTAKSTKPARKIKKLL